MRVKLMICYENVRLKLLWLCRSIWYPRQNEKRNTCPLRFIENQRVVSCLLDTNGGEFSEPYDYIEAIWLRNMIWEFGYSHEQVEILCDSESALALCKNNVNHEKINHVDIKFRFIWENDNSYKISTLYNHIDIFTKVVHVNKLNEALENFCSAGETGRIK